MESDSAPCPETIYMRTCRCLRHLSMLMLCLLIAAPAQADPTAGNPVSPWPATDALGRKLPTPDEVGPTRPNRYVGIFYFLWLNERTNKSPHEDGPYDVSKILARDPDALKKPDSPLWGPVGRYHYW